MHARYVVCWYIIEEFIYCLMKFCIMLHQSIQLDPLPPHVIYYCMCYVIAHVRKGERGSSRSH